METFKENIKKQIDFMKISQDFKIGDEINAYIILGTRKIAQDVSKNILSNVIFNSLKFIITLVNLISLRVTAIEASMPQEVRLNNLWQIDYCIKSGFHCHVYTVSCGIKEIETF